MNVLTKLVLLVALSAGGVALSHGTASAASCSLSTATMAFGNYDVYTATPTRINGAITGVCSSGSPTEKPVIALAAGLHGTISARKMKWASCVTGVTGCTTVTDTLTYNLYTSAAYTTIWGNGATGSKVTLAAGCCTSGTPFSATIYGEIPAAVAHGTNDVAAGIYGDTVVVTMTF